ncbi:MAG: putative transporter permease protein [Thermomicrobiales bacterium]|jgi:multiple sugar transport system permease protein|nr:putative transporter permease protein [Thermomicrobiales bacterium]MDF2758304.1 putative transporter permease protein [Thermomicrobiales bacterium]MDF3015123.1 putative transporter permease protein [Thermomicrobiales bacterium]
MIASRERIDARKMLGSILAFLVIAVVIIWTLFPIYWAAISSVKSSTDNYGNLWIPWLHFEPTLKPWRDMFALPEIKSATLISTQLSLGAATLSLVLGTLAAYGIARFRFFRPQNGSLTTWFLSQRIAPPVIFVAPYFLIMRQAGLLDNVWGLIILNATFNMTFPIIILTQMFREVPVELEEAAQVDGASRWEMFFRISLPLVAPGLVVAWMLALAFSWNEFLFAFSTSVQNRPLSVAIVGAEQTRGVDYQFVGTRTLWAMIVPLIAALLAQRYIVRGLSLGAVKG